jgi:hypothetical protein
MVNLLGLPCILPFILLSSFPTPFCLPCFCFPFQLPLSLLFPPSRHIPRQLIILKNYINISFCSSTDLCSALPLSVGSVGSSVSGPESDFLFRKYTTLHTEPSLYRG